MSFCHTVTRKLLNHKINDRSPHWSSVTIAYHLIVFFDHNEKGKQVQQQRLPIMRKGTEKRYHERYREEG